MKVKYLLVVYLISIEIFYKEIAEETGIDLVSQNYIEQLMGHCRYQEKNKYNS